MLGGLTSKLSAAMAETVRIRRDFKRVGQLEAQHFRLKGLRFAPISMDR